MKSRRVGMSALALTVAMLVAGCWLLVAGCWLLVACGEDGGTGTERVGEVADFNDEVFRSTSWTELSPELASSDSPTGEMQTGIQEIVGDDEYMCSTTQYFMTETPFEFISMQLEIRID